MAGSAHAASSVVLRFRHIHDHEILHHRSRADAPVAILLGQVGQLVTTGRRESRPRSTRRTYRSAIPGLRCCMNHRQCGRAYMSSGTTFSSHRARIELVAKTLSSIAARKLLCGPSPAFKNRCFMRACDRGSRAAPVWSRNSTVIAPPPPSPAALRLLAQMPAASHREDADRPTSPPPTRSA